MTKINQLDSLKVFKTVVESGSFSAAAKRLDISAARVSKSIERLEAELETTLFHRSTRQMQITDSGEACYQKALVLLNQWTTLKDELVETQEKPKGKLRISIPMTWGLSQFAPILAEFMAAYPDIHLDIQMNDQHVNVLEGEYDLVLRLTQQLSDSSLLCQRITSYSFIACAAPAYIEKHGIPQHPSELIEHDCLSYNLPGTAIKWLFYDGKKSLEVHMEPKLKSNNSQLFHGALLAGLGICQVPEFLVTDDIASGRLVPILQEFDAPILNLYTLRPKDRRATYRLKLLNDFLQRHLKKD